MQKINSTKLIDLICLEVEAKYANFDGNVFVNIDGFTATGKSSLTSDIRSLLLTKGFFVEVLPTDDFIRYTREERKITQERYLNHKDWYDLDRLTSVAVLMKDAAPIDLKIHGLYNHASGEKDLNKEFFAKKNMIIIIEGMYALQIDLIPSYKVVLLASHNKLLERVIERDKLVRGISKLISEKRYWVHNGEIYQKSLATCITKADLIIDTSDFDNPTIVSYKSAVYSWSVSNEILAKYMPNLLKTNNPKKDLDQV